jgi:deazaflavin-dependent oxidoreductase (nitroreductase family)
MYNSKLVADEELQPDPSGRNRRRTQTGGVGSMPPMDARAARPFQNRPVRRAILGVIRTRFNPLVTRLAVTGRMQSIAMVHHQGRKSGRTYATPTSARPISGGFVIAMTFGPESDWVQNLLAAGGCEIDWKGRQYSLVHPEIIDWATARTAFSPLERILLRAIGMTSFIRLRHLLLMDVRDYDERNTEIEALHHAVHPAVTEEDAGVRQDLQLRKGGRGQEVRW